jgi:hypothetical protein
MYTTNVEIVLKFDLEKLLRMKMFADSGIFDGI